METTILLVVVLGAFIAFQVFQGRKRKRETEARRSAFAPGVEIMTNYGLFGTILEMDDERNLVTIETTPGTVLKIHKQTILKVADYDTLVTTDDVSAESDDPDEAAREQLVAGDERVAEVRADDAPTYGERITDADTTRSAEKRRDE